MTEKYVTTHDLKGEYVIIRTGKIEIAGVLVEVFERPFSYVLKDYVIYDAETDVEEIVEKGELIHVHPVPPYMIKVKKITNYTLKQKLKQI